MDPIDEKLSLIADAANRASRYLKSSESAPVYPSSIAIDRLAYFSDVLPETSTDPHTILCMLDEFGSPATVRSTKGRYFGFVNGNSEPIGTAALMLAGTWDQNVGLPIASPAASHLDAIAAKWVCEILGLPDTSVASFCAGATIANLTCILAARDALLAKAGWNVQERGLQGAPRLRVVASQEVHVSVLKSLRAAGFGSDAISLVETDNLGRLRADRFPHTDAMTLVVLQAGNVNTGHSDPFPDVIPQVRDQGGWVHVDGAFGLWAAASPRQSVHVAGCQDADSWATDAHKWLKTRCVNDDPLFYAIIDPTTENAIGLASYLRIEPESGVIEVGHLHYSTQLRRTPAATEAMHLMMARAFDELGYRRYEWKCDAMNERSRNAALRLGFSFEGTLRQAMIYKGRNRDTDWFSVTDQDWIRLSEAHKLWLRPENFDCNGRQRVRLSTLTKRPLQRSD